MLFSISKQQQNNINPITFEQNLGLAQFQIHQVVLIYFFAFKIKIGNQINFFSSMKSCDSALNE
jgi:hypothetical protein